MWRADSQSIAYVVPGAQSSMFVTSPAGDPHLIASDMASVQLVRFAPHGTALAFVGAVYNGVGGLWIVDTATPDVASQVQTDVADFAWSPDGTKIAYGHGSKLELLTLGGAPVVLAEHANLVQSIHWSNDGQWIAYVVETTAVDQAALYVVRADGSGQPQAASGSTNASAASFEFSPTNAVLAYTPFVDDDRALYFIDLASGSPSLMKVSTEDQRPRQIGDFPAFASGWSPDGSKYVYALDGNGFPQPPPTAFMVDATARPTPAPVAIADGYDVVSFVWSSDSENLLAQYRRQLPDGATIFQFGRVVAGGLQPLDEVSRTAHCARWR